MSGRLLTLAWEVPDLPPAMRLVFMALADCADREGRNAFPSVQTMAEHCQLSARTVQAALAELRSRALIAVQTPAGFRRATTYRLFPEGAVFAPLQPEKGAAAAPLVGSVKGADMGANMGANPDAHIRSDPGDPGDRLPPNPPASAGGQITKRELREAERLRLRLAKAYGRSCLHDPRCATLDDCLLLIVDGRRQERADALERRAARLAS